MQNVHLEVQRGSVNALIGPSGCGKTTFLRAINRMHDLTPGARVSGKILLDGEDVYGRRGGPREHAPPRGHGLPEAQPLSHHERL